MDKKWGKADVTPANEENRTMPCLHIGGRPCPTKGKLPCLSIYIDVCAPAYGIDNPPYLQFTINHISQQFMDVEDFVKMLALLSEGKEVTLVDLEDRIVVKVSK